MNPRCGKAPPTATRNIKPESLREAFTRILPLPQPRPATMAQGARWHQPVLLQRLAGTLQILLLKVIEYSVVLIRGSFDVAALSHMGIFIAVYGTSLSLDQSQQMQVRTVLQKEGVPVGVDSEGLRRIILGGGSELVVVLTEPVDDVETNRRRQLPGIAFQLDLQGRKRSSGHRRGRLRVSSACASCHSVKRLIEWLRCVCLGDPWDVPALQLSVALGWVVSYAALGTEGSRVGHVVTPIIKQHLALFQTGQGKSASTDTIHDFSTQG